MLVVFILFKGRNRLENFTRSPTSLRLGVATTKAGLEERANSLVIDNFNVLKEDKSLYLVLRKKTLLKNGYRNVF